MKTISTLIVLVVLCASLALAASRSGSQPTGLSMLPSSAARGSTVLVQVTLDQPSPDYATLSVSSVAADWSSIPSSVGVVPDQSVVEFYATVSSSTSASSTGVTAACNGGQASGTLTITP